MVEVILNTRISVSENANFYFDAGKKAKRKIDGAKKAIAASQKQIDELNSKKDEYIKKMGDQRAKDTAKKDMKKEWFDKFRWFYTSKGHLVIGGRDATTNEIVVKKHTDEHDLVFHTDMAGSPFFILKLNNDTATPEEIKEVGDATSTYSRGFKMGLATNQVFYVNPDQVSKEANPGEFIGKGAFMIRGKTNYVSDVSMEIAIGVVDGVLQAAPFDSLVGKTDKIVVLIQGDKKSSDVAKIISKTLEHSNIDDIITKLPTGTFSILDERKIKEKIMNKKYAKK